MTSATTARALRDAGVVWRPVKGDRFVIPDREMDADVFVVSDMTIEAHDLPSGQVLGFNGTTEWALDSVEASEVLWLPHEGQLRALLAEAFVALTRRGPLWEVTTRRPIGDDVVDVAAGSTVEVVTAADDAEEAYALALLAVTVGRAQQRHPAAAVVGQALQLLPLAAGALAARLVPLDADGWATPTPDGGRTVAQVVSGAVGGAGVHPEVGWRFALEGLLEAWAASREAVDTAEAAAHGVLEDLVTATREVSRATGQADDPDPALVHLLAGVPR